MAIQIPLKSVVGKEPMQEGEHHPTTKERLAHRIVWCILAMSFFCMGVLVYWAVSNNDVLEVKNSPVPVRTITPNPTADGVVFLKIAYCKKVKAEGKVRLSFVNQSREVFVPISIDRQDPVCKTAEIPITIPHEIVPAEYHIHFRITYQVNPLKVVTEEFDSLPFKVGL
jgi:hypothetical protein